MENSFQGYLQLYKIFYMLTDPCGDLRSNSDIMEALSGKEILGQDHFLQLIRNLSGRMDFLFGMPWRSNICGQGSWTLAGMGSNEN